MPLFFSCFAFILVHFYTVDMVAALPAAQATTVMTQTLETASKQMKAPVELFSQKIGNSVFRHFTPSFDHVRDKKSDENKESKREFRSCRVSNKTYQHKEQIPRIDPCEKCVCVDSEMYCFWKLCTFFNLSTVTQAPSNASISKHKKAAKQSINDNKITLRKTNATEIKVDESETTDEKFSKMLKDQRKFNALKKLEATSPKNLGTGTMKNQDFITSTEKPTVCYVMGVMYKYGEVLPRDTGTCLECACSEGGRVSCSPKDCVSQPDLDYLSHNNNLDMFDLDTF